MPATWRPSICRCISQTSSKGIICAIGISCSFILTLTFHTAARYLIDSKSSDSNSVIPRSSKLIDTITHFSIHSVKNHPITIVAATVVITLLSIGGATQLETSFTLDDFLSDDLEIMVIGKHVSEDYRKVVKGLCYLNLSLQ